MNSYAKYIEKKIGEEPANRLFEASMLYQQSLTLGSEMTYYKTLERMCKQGKLIHLTKGIYYRPKQSKFGTVPISDKEIASHYTEGKKGIVIGYRLYNQKELTTQIGKRLEVLSSAVSEQKKNIGNVSVKKCEIAFTRENIPIIETLEILQNYKGIEDISKPALAAYMRAFAVSYSDSVTMDVLKNRKYKKSTIAFLKSFLDYLEINNSLNQFLSALSTYKIPEMEEFYESACQ